MKSLKMELTDTTTDLTLELVITDILVPLSHKKALDAGFILKTATKRSFEARELALHMIEYYEHELKESAAYLAAIESEAPSMYDSAIAYHIATRAAVNDTLKWIRGKFRVYSSRLSYLQRKT